MNSIPCAEIPRCLTVDLFTPVDGSQFAIDLHFIDPEDATAKAVRVWLDPVQAGRLSALLEAACSHFGIERQREPRGPKDAN